MCYAELPKETHLKFLNHNNKENILEAYRGRGNVIHKGKFFKKKRKENQHCAGLKILSNKKAKGNKEVYRILGA